MWARSQEARPRRVREARQDPLGGTAGASSQTVPVWRFPVILHAEPSIELPNHHPWLRHYEPARSCLTRTSPESFTFTINDEDTNLPTLSAVPRPPRCCRGRADDEAFGALLLLLAHDLSAEYEHCQPRRTIPPLFPTESDFASCCMLRR